MKQYNKLYKQNKNVWGEQPNKLLEMIWQDVDPGSHVLDLGCGQGRDALFLAKKNFKVIAIDSAQSGIDGLNKFITENKLDNIQAACKNIEDFIIEPDKYSIINAMNIFQFLDKGDSLNMIKNIQASLKLDGFVIIAGFSVDDSSFKEGKGFFDKNELNELFSNFKIVFYKEITVEDPGHPGYEKPHQHHVVRLIAQKI
jgi:tellurite methyltransferase